MLDKLSVVSIMSDGKEKHKERENAFVMETVSTQ